MTNPAAVVRTSVRSFDEDPRVATEKSLLFWCPGCDDNHRIVFWRANGAEVWMWDGNIEAPTISPSIKMTGVQGKPSDGFHKPNHKVAPGEPIVCHSFLRAGRWEFLTDSTHVLAGQTVDMVPLPDWLVTE